MTAITCPHCGGQAFTDYGDGLVACQRCYTQFDLNQQQCPQCGSLLSEGSAVCLQCGADLRGDLIDRSLKEHLMTPQERRRARLSAVKQARAVGEETSRQRMEAWWEQDRQRKEREQAEQMARQRRERRLIAIAAVVLLLIVLIVTVIGLAILSSPEPEPTPTAWLIWQCIVG